MKSKIIKNNFKINHWVVSCFITLTACTVLLNHDLASADLNLNNITIYPDKIFIGDVAFIKISDINKNHNVSILFNDKEYFLDFDNASRSFLGLIAVKQETKQAKAKLQILLDNKTKTNIELNIHHKEFPTQHLTLPKSKVDLSKKDLERHYKEKDLISKVFDNANKHKIFNSTFIKPLNNKISTPFGVRRYMNNKPKNSHSGIDIKAKLFEPIKSINKGIVVLTGNHFFSGNSVYVDHGLGIISMYFHLSEIKVKKGDPVNKGDIIGLAGSTGRSTGPHLHWGIRVNNVKVDPQSLIVLNPYL